MENMECGESIEIKKIVDLLGIIEEMYMGKPAYYITKPGEKETAKGGRVAIPVDAMHLMIQEALNNGRSIRVLDTFIEQEVDHDTYPPNGNDYHWWERGKDGSWW